MIALPRKPQLILSSQEVLLQETSPEQEDTKISQDHTVPWKEARRVFSTVDIAAHHSIEVTPADDEPKSDSTFVDSLDVVTRPRDGVGDARVNTQGAQERSRVRDTSPLASDQHGKPDEAEEGASDIANSTLASPISDVTDSDGQDGSRSIWRDGKQLRFGGSIPELCADRQPN